MIIEYGNLVHILTIVVALFVVFITTFLLKNAKEKTKSMVIFAVLFINLNQHLFKFLVWPQYYGTKFSEINTAYNMCALLIIVSPFIFLSKSKLLKDFLFYIGTTAGLIAISIPYWFIGRDILNFEYLRFYICHLFLFVGSILPVTLNLHKPSLKNVYKIGFLCLVALLIVLFNGLVFSFINNPLDKTQALNSFYSRNPVWAMRPSESFPKVTKIIEIFSPKIFLGNNDGKEYTPIMWYIIPMYMLITLSCTIACLITNLIKKEKLNA